MLKKSIPLLIGGAAAFSPLTLHAVIWETPAPVFLDFRAALFFPFDALLPVTLLVLLRDKRYGERWGSVMAETPAFFWLALLIWTAYGALSIAETPTLAWIAVLRGLAFLLLAWLIAATPDGLRPLLSAFVIGAVLHAGIGLAQTLNRDSLGLPGEIVWRESDLSNFGADTENFRAYGLAVNPNNLAGFLMLAVFAALTLAQGAVKRARDGWLAASAFIAAGMLATESRAALLGALIGGLPLLWRWRGWRAVIVAAGIGSLGLMLLSLAGGRDITERLFFAFPETSAVIGESPLFGVGAGNLMLRIAANNPTPTDTLLPAHNVAWVVWAEGGIVGVILLAAAFLTTARYAFRHATAPIIGGWLALGVVCLLDYYLWLDWRARLLMFIWLGLCWVAPTRESVSPQEM